MLGERFDLVEPHTVSMYHHDEFKGITVLSNRTERWAVRKRIRDAGSSWHSDYSYKPVPANATMLYALEIRTPAATRFSRILPPPIVGFVR